MIFLFYVFVIFVIVVFMIRLWWMNTIYGKAAAFVDKHYLGPQGWPLAGNVFQFKTNPAELVNQVFDWYKTYGSPTRFKFGPFASIHLFRADHVEAMLTSTTNITKSRDYEMVADWLGHGLLTSTGKRWFRKRKLLTPAFHFQILKDFMPIFNEQAEKFVKILKTKAVANMEPYNISKLLSLCTLDVICETAMGKRLNAMDNANSPYINAIMDFAEVILQRTMKPWLWPDFIFYNFSSVGRASKKQLKILHEFTWTVIKEREAERERRNKCSDQQSRSISDGFDKKRRLAFLDMLLEMKGKGVIDAEEVREEVDTFMFEGHDTTATGLMWAIYCIGRNPECQKKIDEELDSILGAVRVCDSGIIHKLRDTNWREDLSVCPAADQLPHMKYLECCIKESQRIYPSVPIIARKITESLKIDEDHILPEGAVINVNFPALHRDPTYFPEPMKYDPDRFLPENSGGRPPFAFVPFSAGPRNCIGQKFAMMEEKVILCHLLRNFWVDSVEPEESIDPAILLVFRPMKGIFVKLTPRY